MQLKIIFIVTMLLTSSILFSQKNRLPIFTAKLDNRLNITDGINVKITIKNNSANTLYYLTMTCSWKEFYITDSKIITVRMDACEKNFLTIAKIPPYQQVEKILSLGSDIKQPKGTKFKVGFKFYPIKKLKNINVLSLEKYCNPKNEVLLWSQDLEL